jgi:DNA topoisomerase-1
MALAGVGESSTDESNRTDCFLPDVLHRMAKKWLLRKGTPRSGFRYVDEEGRAIRERRTLHRVDALRIPPAWRDVHIAASAATAIQAWGFDARGRKQYRYHDRAVGRRELRKYYRVRQLAKELPRIRRRLREVTHAKGMSREFAAATALRLISESFCRVGGERYLKENGTFGVTTLRKRHARVEGDRVVLEYVGKGNKEQRQVIVSRELAQLVRRLLGTPGPRLFRYRDAEGSWRDLTAREVNEYLHDCVSSRYSAKDFRTWGGTLRAATVLAELGPAPSATEAKRNVALAMRLVSSELGNTPTICRQSYVHPIVVARYLDEGETISLPRSRRAATNLGLAHSPEERALIAFLDRHFPERRRAPRTEELAMSA